MVLVLLLAILLLLTWFVRNDAAEYAAFKRLETSEARRQAFRRWTLKSFAFFGLGALMVLVLLGRIGTLWRLPPEFAGPAFAIEQHLSSGSGGLSPGFLIGASIALVAGGVIGGLVAAFRRKGGKGASHVAGDVEPLFPRNSEERRWTALLAANAGPSEELFFRLMLPLLFTLATGNVVLAFAVSALIFGAIHFYQGWAGILSTTLAGFLFTGLYLATGTLWVPIVLHSLINLNSLWLQPWLSEWLNRSSP